MPDIDWYHVLLISIGALYGRFVWTWISKWIAQRIEPHWFCPHCNFRAWSDETTLADVERIHMEGHP